MRTLINNDNLLIHLSFTCDKIYTTDNCKTCNIILIGTYTNRIKFFVDETTIFSYIIFNSPVFLI